MRNLILKEIKSRLSGRVLARVQLLTKNRCSDDGFCLWVVRWQLTEEIGCSVCCWQPRLCGSVCSRFTACIIVLISTVRMS
jgi:hypothetical protein